MIRKLVRVLSRADHLADTGRIGHRADASRPDDGVDLVVLEDQRFISLGEEHARRRRDAEADRTRAERSS
jgi:hypothetical protein